MADSILGNISQEATLEELLGGSLLLLAAILEKLPRLDGNERLLTNASEVTSTVAVSGAISSVTTVSTVSTVAAVNALQAMGSSARPADAIPMHLSNAGAMHIYDNIKVS